MTLMGRALKGVREHVRTQVVSIATVALALFCLGGALLMLENARAISTRWGGPVRTTVYLRDDASAEDIEQLRGALAAFSEVAEARYVTPSEARTALLAGSVQNDEALAGAPVELFPSTIELRLRPGATDASRLDALALRVRRLPMVSDVETYRGLTDQLRGMLGSGKAAAGVFALLVLICAMAVVSNTVRLSLHHRMREVEVLRLVGASVDYVRAPFLVEGAMLGAVGALVALVALAGSYLWLRLRMGPSLAALLGMPPVFLSGAAVGLFLVCGGLVGAAGGALAVRRWLRV